MYSGRIHQYGGFRPPIHPRRLCGLLPLALAPLLSASVLCAQDVRTVTTMRQFAGQEQLGVAVEYGAGRLRIEPGAKGALYRASLSYDADVFQPVTAYADGRLRLGLKGRNGVKIRGHRASRLDLALGPDAPLDLDLKFGAVEANIELGGLRVRRLEVSTGASETVLRFSQPNPERCRIVELEAGAAAFRVFGLGNANAERLTFDGGVGDILLDFTGEWRGDMTADIDMGVGSLTLNVPHGLGLQITRDTFLTSFDPEGLVKRGNSYYSQDWNDAKHRLTIQIDAAFGAIAVRWVGSLNSI
ncbi:MAG: hypothetical protein HY703_11275 [Gemmatimonadetes bacterium]|nr:hypothetical protein [Gemmatimonadota bacterium]